jgi:hypothetical protein
MEAASSTPSPMTWSSIAQNKHTANYISASQSRPCLAIPQSTRDVPLREAFRRLALQ